MTIVNQDPRRRHLHDRQREEGGHAQVAQMAFDRLKLLTPHLTGRVHAGDFRRRRAKQVGLRAHVTSSVFSGIRRTSTTYSLTQMAAYRHFARLEANAEERDKDFPQDGALALAGANRDVEARCHHRRPIEGSEVLHEAARQLLGVILPVVGGSRGAAEVYGMSSSQ